MNRATQRQQQIKYLTNLADNLSSQNTTEGSSPDLHKSVKLALTDDLGSEPFKLLPSIYNGILTTDVYSDTADIVKDLNNGNLDYAVMEYSQMVKYKHMGAKLESILPCYSTEIKYCLIRNIYSSGPCTSVAYVSGSPSEYYSILLNNETATGILNPSFKRISVKSTAEAVRLVKLGEIDGALFDAKDRLPAGVKIAAQFQPQVFYYMLVVNYKLNPLLFQYAASRTFSNSEKAALDVSDTIYKLNDKLKTSKQHGLLLNSMKRLNPEGANLWKQAMTRGSICYIGKDSLAPSSPNHSPNLSYLYSKYNDMGLSILTNWRLAGTYDFPHQEKEDSSRLAYYSNTVSSLLAKYDIADRYKFKNSPPRWSAEDSEESEKSGKSYPLKSQDQPNYESPTDAQSEFTDDSSADNPSLSATDKQSETSPQSAPTKKYKKNKNSSATPKWKAESTKHSKTDQHGLSESSDRPVSDKELFKEEIDRGLLPPPPEVPPAPKISDELIE
ncbi:MAG: hypothetical protein ACI376_00520 [Candidatus Bruticola sp.]